MNLAIDIGNTAVKTGWFDGDELLEKQHQLTVESLKQLINVKKPTNVIISSTGKDEFKDVGFGESNVFWLSHQLKFPFTINYTTPQTLGADRLAAMAGVSKLFSKESILVIDTGTCVTYDFLSKDNIYFGGAISPGLDMRFKAMHHYTSRLPQVSVPEYFPSLIGDSTVESMRSGVLNGMVYEMQGMVDAYREKFGRIKIILTGGNKHIFEKKFKEPIFATPDLILIGLNVILQYNVESF